LPTAYIRIKVNAPSITDQDAVAARLMFEILSEELGDEIRTKRSLSYAVHAFLIEYHVGVGVLNASTSKPKETLVAINDVLQKMKSKDWTNEELAEYKTGFATSFYLTQETHASLASALGSALYFYGDANEHYELPRQLEKVTPADIKRLANRWLSDLRVGIIFGRSEFKDEWAQDLIKKNLSSAASTTPGG
jgi:predicted Zn-dependent peptidase